jgi:hypothetical protein
MSIPKSKVMSARLGSIFMAPAPFAAPHPKRERRIRNDPYYLIPFILACGLLYVHLLQIVSGGRTATKLAGFGTVFPGPAWHLAAPIIFMFMKE